MHSLMSHKCVQCSCKCIFCVMEEVKRNFHYVCVSHSSFNISAFMPGVIPSIKVLECISYIKFRYSGDIPKNKYYEKDFMTLRVSTRIIDDC